MSETFYKTLTPSLKQDINRSIDENTDEEVIENCG